MFNSGDVAGGGGGGGGGITSQLEKKLTREVYEHTLPVCFPLPSICKSISSCGFCCCGPNIQYLYKKIQLQWHSMVICWTIMYILKVLEITISLKYYGANQCHVLMQK